MYEINLKIIIENFKKYRGRTRQDNLVYLVLNELWHNFSIFKPTNHIKSKESDRHSFPKAANVGDDNDIVILQENILILINL